MLLTLFFINLLTLVASINTKSPVWNVSLTTEIKNKPVLSQDGLNMYVSSYNKSYDLYHLKIHDGNSSQLKCRWWHDISQLVTEEIFISPIVDNTGENIYVITQDNFLISYDLTKPGNFYNNYCYPPPISLTVNLNFLSGKIRSTPVLNNDNTVLYFGTIEPDNSIYAVTIMGDLIWRFQTQGSVFSSPTLSQNTNDLVIGSEDGNIYSIDTITGIPNWIFETQNFIAESPTIYKDTVVISSKDELLYILDLSTGYQNKNISTSNIKRPIFFENNILTVSTNGTVTCYQTTYNEYYNQVWYLNLGDNIKSNGILGDNNNILYISTIQGYIYAIDVSSGNILWTSKIGGEVYADLELAPRCPDFRCIQSLYVCNLAGTIYAFNTTFDRPNWKINPDLVVAENNITDYLIIGFKKVNSYELSYLNTEENIIKWNISLPYYQDSYLMDYMETNIFNNIYVFYAKYLYVIDKFNGNIISNYSTSCLSAPQYFLLDGNMFYSCLLNNQLYTINKFNLISQKNTLIYQGNNIIMNFQVTPDNKSFIFMESIYGSTYQNYISKFNVSTLELVVNNTVGPIQIIYLTNNSIIYTKQEANNINSVNTLNINDFSNTVILNFTYYNPNHLLKFQENYMLLYKEPDLLLIDLNNNKSKTKQIGNNVFQYYLENNNIKVFNRTDTGEFQMLVYDYNFTSIKNYTWNIPSFTNFLFNPDNSLIYVNGLNYIYAINLDSKIIWQYPFNTNTYLNYPIYLTPDQKNIITQNLISLPIPFY